MNVANIGTRELLERYHALVLARKQREADQLVGNGNKRFDSIVGVRNAIIQGMIALRGQTVGLPDV